MNLKEKILKHGIDNCLFMVKMLPVRNIMGIISYTSSNDEYVIVPAKITEKRYKIEKNYKIELKSIYDGFGSKIFYLSDLERIISDKHAEMFVKEK